MKWFLWLLLFGCVTTPETRFFMLNVPVNSEKNAAIALNIGIGPIQLPSHLNRPQLVRRQQVELFIDEQYRWGGELRDQITVNLARRLQQKLPNSTLIPFPWPDDQVLDRRLRMTFRQFEAVEQQGVIEVDWAWDGAQPKTFFAAKPLVNPQDPVELVEVLGQLLAQFADYLGAHLE